VTDPVRKYQDLRGQKCVQALQRNGFKALYCPTAKSAREEVIRLAGQPHSVGFGGSVTVRNLGLVDHFRQNGCQVLDIWDENLSAKELLNIRRATLTCDVFLASANAVTLDGCIINLDGTGNRVSASIFGPQKIILVVGVNKIVPDVATGIARTRQVAAPQNYIRKTSPAPCAETGVCNNCRMPAKECRVLVILEAVPKGTPDYHVLVVGEELGY